MSRSRSELLNADNGQPWLPPTQALKSPSSELREAYNASVPVAPNHAVSKEVGLVL